MNDNELLKKLPVGTKGNKLIKKQTLKISNPLSISLLVFKDFKKYLNIL